MRSRWVRGEVVVPAADVQQRDRDVVGVRDHVDVAPEHGRWSRARVPTRGREHGTEQVLIGAAGRPGQVASVVPANGLDQEAVTTLGGRWAGGGAVASSSEGPLGSVGEQPAAAARPQRMPQRIRSAVRSVLTGP